jgi:hypothetical protein
MFLLQETGFGLNTLGNVVSDNARQEILLEAS